MTGRYRGYLVFEVTLDAVSATDAEAQIDEQLGSFDPPGDWTYEGVYRSGPGFPGFRLGVEAL